MNIKTKLHAECNIYINKRIQNCRSSMEEAQRAANEESKSSVGDKYETTRAMMQLERDKHAVQLSEALKVKQQIESIDSQKPTDQVTAGSLVITDTASYYIAISAGKITLEQTTYYCISIQAPIAQAFRGKKVGDTIKFNGRSIQIREIF